MSTLLCIAGSVLGLLASSAAPPLYDEEVNPMPGTRPAASFSDLLPVANCALFNKNTCTLCGPKGKSKGCTANFCYSNGLRAQKRGGGAEAKSWCGKRNGEGCGCQWVAKRKPYAQYGQTRKDKGNYG